MSEVFDPRLDCLELENFQTFAARVSVPLGRIVLLFGPNSAGKSAVLDGLKIVSEMLQSFAGTLRPDDYYPEGKHIADESAWADRFARQVRKASWSEHPLHLGGLETAPASLALSLRWPASTIASGLRNELFDLVGPRGAAETVHIELKGWPLASTPRPGLMPLVAAFEIKVNGRHLLGASPESISLNLGHPSLRGAKLRTRHADAFTKVPQTRLAIVDGVYNWRLGADFHKWRLEVGMMKDAFVSDAGDTSVDLTVDGSNYLRLAERAFDEFAASFEAVLGIVCAESARLTSLAVVDASRQIPTPNELLFAFQRVNETGTVIAAARPGVEVRPNPDYLYLTRGLFEDWWGETFNEVVSTDFFMSSVPEEWSVHKRVNRALSESLFVDKLYRCTVDVEAILDSHLLKSIVEATHDPTDISGAKFLVRLQLQDGDGRRLEFEDVGSGLGYLLPVLVQLIAPKSSGSVFVQQPELHLHPALQAALGDVVIEATHSARTTIIETHSEHLLLRLLRRVREGAQPRSTLPPDLIISAEDLVVVYFDPQSSGGTRVRRLRVSDDGDFLDRWPRGFFDERDQELFADGGPLSHE